MINGFVRGQQLTVRHPVIAADTINYLTVLFTFHTRDWAGLEKWTHWQRGDVVYDIPLVNDQITEDAHLNLDAGEWTVWIHGNRYADGIVVQRITTDKAKITVVPTGTLDGEPFPEMPASVTEQILARLDAAEKAKLDPVPTSEAMTQPVGRDEQGRLFTAPTGGGGGSGGIIAETDPTVPAWAKRPDPPTYTAADVGALPANTPIPEKTSDLTNDSGYITIAVATLLNYYLKTEVYNRSEAYSRTEVDNLISGLDKRLNAIADSTDVDLDQLSEIVAYIKANKSLIDSITTSKVSVSDIVNNLTTEDAAKPLSAAQGKVLKGLYDALPAWAKAASKPTYTKSEIGLGNVDNVRQYSASNPPPYPVTSVNGKTGAVSLSASEVGARPDTWTPTASDVGALPSGTKIPAKTSDITNDSGFITKAVADLTNYYTKSQTYTQAEINALVSAIPKFAISVVSALPTTGISTTTVYLVISGTDGDLYTEYIYVGGAWEILGSQRVDLTGYATEAWVNVQIADFLTADKLTAAMVTGALGFAPAKAADVPAVDSTLKVSGAAADAAVVGGKFTEVSEAITDYENGAGLIHTPSPNKPQTYIINNVQDSTTYRTSGTVTEDTTDKILWDKSVRVSGSGAYIRFHKNYSPFSVNLKDNLLVVKIKINSMASGAELNVKVGNSSNPSNLIGYNLMRHAADTVYGEWQEFTISHKSFYTTTADLSVFDFENIDDIYIISASGASDFNIQFIGYRPNTLSKGIVSFTFDDGWKTAADGIKALAERGATGTLYVIKDATGNDYLTVAEMQELRQLYGTDIQAHGGTEYQNLTDEQLVEHFRSIKKFLAENGLGNGDHLAYPGGMNPTRAYNLVKKYFQSARTIQSYSVFESFPPFDSHRMRAATGVSQNGSMHATRIKRYIDNAVETNSWLILVFHKIDDGTDSVSCNMETFEELVDYAVNSGISIKNIAEVFETNGGGQSVNISEITDAVIDALPVYGGEVE